MSGGTKCYVVMCGVPYDDYETVDRVFLNRESCLQHLIDIEKAQEDEEEYEKYSYRFVVKDLVIE